MFRFHYDVQRPPIDNESCSKTYDCDLCDSGDWLSETEVEIHKRTVHVKELRELLMRENVCHTCGHQFQDKEDVIRHIKKVHLLSSSSARRVEREIFICDHCHDIFFNKDMLAIHIVHRHKNRVTLPCPLCQKPLNPKLVYGHLTGIHLFQSVCLCPICLSKRPDRRELVNHGKTHNKYYHCNICGYMSTRERNFNIHLDTYASRAPCPLPANWQDCFLPPRGAVARYSLLSSRRAGLSGVALGNGLRLCVLCRAVCRPAERVSHMAQDHATPEVQEKAVYKCSCGEEFLNAIVLKHHVFKMKGDHKILKKEEIFQRAIEAASVAEEYEIEGHNIDDIPQSSPKRLRSEDDENDSYKKEEIFQRAIEAASVAEEYEIEGHRFLVKDIDDIPQSSPKRLRSEDDENDSYKKEEIFQRAIEAASVAEEYEIEGHRFLVKDIDDIPQSSPKRLRSEDDENDSYIILVTDENSSAEIKLKTDVTEEQIKGASQSLYNESAEEETESEVEIL